MCVKVSTISAYWLSEWILERRFIDADSGLKAEIKNMTLNCYTNTRKCIIIILNNQWNIMLKDSVSIEVRSGMSNSTLASGTL